MFKSYLLTAVRSLVSQRLYSVINIGGLALGLAACILILLFVRDELSYDKWIPNGDQVFKIELTIPIPGRDTLKMGQVPPAIAPELEKYFPDHIEDTTRIYQSDSIVGGNDRFFNERISFVDPDFFNLFDLEMVSGDRSAIARNTTDILINETSARKFFGDQDPLGQPLSLSISRGRGDMSPDFELRVAGVFKDLPQNTHLPFVMLANLDPNRFQGINEGFGGAWMDAAYVKFKKGADKQEVEARLTEFYLSVAPGNDMASEVDDYRRSRTFNFLNVTDVFLYSDKIQQLKPIGDISTVISFSIAASFILLIGAINFMNLSTARALQRAKEVSMRKVLGAGRLQLIRQFLGEAVFTAIIALILAVFVVEGVLPFFNQYVDKAMSFDLISDPLQTLAIVSVAIFVGVLGGIYPAFFLSSYRPSEVLGSSTSHNKGSPFVRQALVVFQFAISISLIVATSIVYEQTNLLRNMDLGFDKEHRLAITGVDGSGVQDNALSIKQEMLNIRGVTGVSMSSDELPLVFYNDIDIEVPTSTGVVNFDADRIFTDGDFFSVYGIKPIAGRVFGLDFASDILVRPEDGSPWTRSAIVTETFLRRAGINNPNDIIGTIVSTPDYGGEGIPLHQKIVGVIPDIHLRQLKERTAQLIFHASESILNVMTLNIVSDDIPATLVEVDKVWKNSVPQVPIKRYFVDDHYDALYNSETRRAEVFAAFAGFGIFVACLGLFGLAAYSTEQRTLEIGIRKIHGASIPSILTLVGTQFMKSVLIANIIAWPVVYFVMTDWLNGYEFRIDISLLVFVMGGLAAMAMAWATVSWQVLKVARKNPVYALRSE